MSQQSNPATLREALAREIADEFCGGSEAVFEAILAKLAASGTEAAPSDEHPFYSRGTMQELNKQMAAASPEGEGREAELPTCDRCHKRVQTVWVETGFAGESELLCGKCVSDEYEQMDDEIAALRQSAAPSGGDLARELKKACGQLLFMNEYIRDAVYGNDYCRKEAAEASAKVAHEGIKVANAALAQESKTGAVTDASADVQKGGQQ